MGKVKSKNTSLDLSMAKTLKELGLPYTMYPKLPGNPDFLFDSKVVVFCDSDFWHGRNWRTLRKKLSEGNNPEYWIPHILKNRRRDRANTKNLTSMGFTVVRLWENEILKKPDECVRRLRESLLYGQR
jgi:DNA mismatch endonuclease (patch repair protein)